MAKRIFAAAFIFSLVVLGIRWTYLDFVDAGMWGAQAQHVELNDGAQYNAGQAYGHPGGPIIIGTIAFNAVMKHFDLPPDRRPYYAPLIAFTTFFASLVIAGCAVVCYLLKKDSWWWAIAAGMLSLNRMYEYATPPTVFVSVLAVFLCLLTLYFYENREAITRKNLFLWALAAGLAVSSRADVGTLATITFLGILVPIIRWKKALYVALGSFAVFCATDPFMWYMPLRHMWDIFAKITYHYALVAPGHTLKTIDLAVTHIDYSILIDISAFAFIAIALSIILFFLKRQIKPILPDTFLFVLYAFTLVLYAIFLSADYQVPRYFQPIIMIWEIFLPLYVFALIEKIDVSFLTSGRQMLVKQGARLFVAAALIGCPAAILFYIWLSF